MAIPPTRASKRSSKGSSLEGLSSSTPLEWALNHVPRGYGLPPDETALEQLNTNILRIQAGGENAHNLLEAEEATETMLNYVISRFNGRAPAQARALAEAWYQTYLQTTGSHESRITTVLQAILGLRDSLRAAPSRHAPDNGGAFGFSGGVFETPPLTPDEALNARIRDLEEATQTILREDPLSVTIVPVRGAFLRLDPHRMVRFARTFDEINRREGINNRLHLSLNNRNLLQELTPEQYAILSKMDQRNIICNENAITYPLVDFLLRGDNARLEAITRWALGRENGKLMFVHALQSVLAWGIRNGNPDMLRNLLASPLMKEFRELVLSALTYYRRDHGNLMITAVFNENRPQLMSSLLVDVFQELDPTGKYRIELMQELRDELGEDQRTLLELALRHGHDAMVNFLLVPHKLRTAPDSEDVLLRTGFRGNCNAETMRRLIGFLGMKSSLPQVSSLTLQVAFERACRARSPEAQRDYLKLIEELLRLASPEAQQSFFRSSLLCTTAELGGMEVIRWVLSLPPDQRGPIDQQNFRGQTPLMLAAREGDWEMMRLLIEKGAAESSAIKALDHRGRGVLMYLTDYMLGEQEAVRNKKDVNERKEAQANLIRAIKMMTYLLDRGARRTGRDEVGHGAFNLLAGIEMQDVSARTQLAKYFTRPEWHENFSEALRTGDLRGVQILLMSVAETLPFRLWDDVYRQLINPHRKEIEGLPQNQAGAAIRNFIRQGWVTSVALSHWSQAMDHQSVRNFNRGLNEFRGVVQKIMELNVRINNDLRRLKLDPLEKDAKRELISTIQKNQKHLMELCKQAEIHHHEVQGAFKVCTKFLRGLDEGMVEAMLRGLPDIIGDLDKRERNELIRMLTGILKDETSLQAMQVKNTELSRYFPQGITQLTLQYLGFPENAHPQMQQLLMTVSGFVRVLQAREDIQSVGLARVADLRAQQQEITQALRQIAADLDKPASNPNPPAPKRG